MKTLPITQEELKKIFVEIFLGTTTKVTKVSDHSVMNGISFGVAAVGQKAMKDIAITEALINPDVAYGAYLDRLANNWGISARFGAFGSSTYVRVVADPGEIYPAGTEFTGNAGIIFKSTEAIILPNEGYAYIPVKSIDIGDRANIPPLSLTQVNPTPASHEYVVNEYMATGGRSSESDEHFRQRIKEGANGIANGTLSKLEQVMMRENSVVLKLFHGGVSENGQNILRVSTVNGADLSLAELDALIIASANYLPLSDYRIYQGIESYGVVIKNAIYQPIDISFRVKILDSYNADNVRKQMQVNISKYFDYRFYNNTGIIQWDDLFQIVKQTAGVEYISDQSFIPGSDFNIPKNVLPRVRGFMIYNLDGTILTDGGGGLDPIYYPSLSDINTQTTI